MPNDFAHIVLLASPLVIFLIFKMSTLRVAVLVSLLGGYLSLPEDLVFDFPLLPPFQKHSIPAFTVLLLVAFAIARSNAAQQSRNAARSASLQVDVLRGWFPRSWLVGGLQLMLSAGAFCTALTNGAPLQIAPERFLPGLRPYDGFNILLLTLVTLIPFFVARRLFSDVEGLRVLIAGIAIGGLVYVLPVLLEVRLSPQLNNWIYGFYQHSFAQHIRAGGFRPMVFLNHGLWVGVFLSCATLACFSMTGFKNVHRAAPWLVAGGGLFVTLFLSKTVGALIITLLLIPVVLFLPLRLRLLAAATIALFSITYPAMRGAHLVPLESIVNAAAKIDQDRAGSLKFRFDNEEQLLTRVEEKPLFGWGSWGRDRVYDDRGNRLTVVDAHWVIYITSFGWVGYAGWTGLLVGPMLLIAFRRRQAGAQPETAAVALILCANMLDMLVNSTMTPVTMLLAGALAGVYERTSLPTEDSELSLDRTRPRRGVEGLSVARKGQVLETAPPTTPRSRYTRQTKVHHRKPVGGG